MKTKLKYAYLRLWSCIYPFNILLDGNDNTITINESLYQALLFLGIEKRNHIYISMLMKSAETRILFRNTDYCFQILPEGMDPASTITRELMYNSHYRVFGFEAACPTIQQMFYSWNIKPFTTVKTSCRPYLTADGNIQFRIYNPK